MRPTSNLIASLVDAGLSAARQRGDIPAHVIAYVDEKFATQREIAKTSFQIKEEEAWKKSWNTPGECMVTAEEELYELRSELSRLLEERREQEKEQLENWKAKIANKQKNKK